MPGSEELFAKLTAYAQAMTQVLDQQSYYDLMEIPVAANAGQIKQAFYRTASYLHPDRYHALPDPAIRDQLATIYARISEGYRVLSNPERRAAYDKALAGGQKRLLSTDREKKGPTAPEDALKNIEARKFYRLGIQAMQKGDWKGAVVNLKFARNYEPMSEMVAEQLMAAEVGLKQFGSK